MLINISPHRSGTCSFTTFCRDHGLKALHWLGDFNNCIEADAGMRWRLYRPLLSVADVFSDLPWPLLYRDIADEFCGARFVFLRRFAWDWVESVQRHLAGRELLNLERSFYAEICGHRETAIDAYEGFELARGYDQFVERAKKHLGCRLTVFDLHDTNLTEHLAELLNVVVKTPFGHER
jgi:hypothetical protein